MGAGFEQRPWEPTKRRGPISAEMKTPGPACVDLPPLLGKLNYNISVISFLRPFSNQPSVSEVPSII